ncbi:MAG: DUF2975 domain-containing protein [Ruminococcus sp.]|nr:DUF2975 domain-containing protein [Ruminococcus sp.]
MKLKSVAVLKVAVIFCMALAVGTAIGAPWIIDWYVSVRHMAPVRGTAILVCYYICMVPALIALYCMLRVLHYITIKRPFEHTAPTYLDIISWCCIAIAVVCGVGAFWYPPLAIVSGAMVFLFLVVRVVSSCFMAGALLQEENDLTV